ncbi:hypothetical protein ASG40_12620 [Methylobacterium sp. Leaf399]|uniref:putative bifunctional diguanylate cyclase/phosphodiesterase n=1 Tax=Methylobacterium sp. Leaf399 TaxID=1736364 RepID=UPI0007010AE2|nr:bifunctional diguanylate cyclase/phosphodiesterase [Methylobacterium sp. Leaf399]KQT07757.1 hypothetical protein ASG40_12620 [Methylobacterium sp. Leaf399]
MATTHFSAIGGEFASASREAAFRADRLPETLRTARLILGISAAINALALIIDWRFLGHPHFWIAVPARLGIVAISVLCLVAIWQATRFSVVQRGLVVWEIVTAVCLGVLCSLRSEIAPLVLIVLPAIYFLVVPTSFRWTLACGSVAMAALATGYLWHEPEATAATGFLVTTVMGEVVLVLFVIRWNRLRRLEWAATQAERHANSELAESRHLFEALFRAVPIPIVVSLADGGRIVSANDAALAFFDVPDTRAFGDYTIRRHLSGDDRRRIASGLSRSAAQQGFEVGLTGRDGRRHDILLSVAAVNIDGQACTISSLVDITSRKAAEERIRIAAHHDALTGLPNRALFQTSLEAAIAGGHATGAEVGLILLDLDGFKEVNDTLGHEAGDALLKEVAGRLGRVAGPGDLVARLGGDEFVVLAAIPGDGQATVHLHRLAEDILDVLNPAMPIGGRIVAPRASLGLAVFPAHAGGGGDLFTNADLALYAAKAAGRNQAVLFTPSLRVQIETRVRIAGEMRTALDEGQLVPFYQPNVGLQGRGIVGFEALARWQHPSRGLLVPADFSTVFDDPDIGNAVGLCLMRRICADVAGWVALGLDPGRVFLNLSATQFAQDNLARTLLGEIDRAGLARDRIGIEVTETVLLGGHGDRVASVLDALHSAGIGVALDDFGTGYASLTHLKQYPVDEIKIDRSFVRDLERDANDAAIVVAVLHLGRSLGLRVTAEGVETEAQAAFLDANGCDTAQGYLYAKPMSASRVPWFLRNRPDILGDDDGSRPRLAG